MFDTSLSNHVWSGYWAGVVTGTTVNVSALSYFYDFYEDFSSHPFLKGTGSSLLFPEKVEGRGHRAEII